MMTGWDGDIVRWCAGERIRGWEYERVILWDGDRRHWFITEIYWTNFYDTFYDGRTSVKGPKYITVHCTLYSVDISEQCTVYSVQFTDYSWQCTVYCASSDGVMPPLHGPKYCRCFCHLFSVYTVYCILYTLYCTLYTSCWILYTSCWILYNVYCLPYTVYCIHRTVYCIM